MPKYIDIHHHILYGVDDGPKTLKAAKKMVDAAVEDGIRVIIATPHIRPGVTPIDMEQYADALKSLNAYCAESENGLQIFSGAEIKYSEATLRFLSEGRVPTMNGTRFILVEWRTSSSFETIQSSVKALTNAGYKVIMAHVERYPSLFKGKRIESLKETFDARIQVDTEAILGKCSFSARCFVKRILDDQLVDYVATDAHDVQERYVQMDEAYCVIKKRCGKRYAREVTCKNQLELFMDPYEDEEIE